MERGQTMSNVASSPQAREMADESMVRNLAAQIAAIWPQEEPIFARDPAPAQILDVGCGTGEIAPRLLKLWPQARLTGVDLEEPHLEKCRPFGDRAKFVKGDALALDLAEGSFDLAVSRHLVQAVPDARKVYSEMIRALKPGGRMHVIAEDYGMLWCHPTELGSDGFWQRIPPLYGKAIGCDLHIGRHTFTIWRELGLTDIKVDYVVVDTLRVPRETFANIWEAWRDGYTDSIVEATKLPRAEVSRRFNEMIACVRDLNGYALWQVPVWTARKS
jgi:SAM-dependent methyltransferase